MFILIFRGYNVLLTHTFFHSPRCHPCRHLCARKEHQPGGPHRGRQRCSCGGYYGSVHKNRFAHELRGWGRNSHPRSAVAERIRFFPGDVTVPTGDRSTRSFPRQSGRKEWFSSAQHMRLGYYRARAHSMARYT